MPFTNDEEIKPKNSKINFNIFILAILFFIASLFTDCFCTSVNCISSIEAFLIGWLAMFVGGAAISWLANPLLIIAWILLFKNKKIAWLFGGLALIFCLSFLMFNKIIENEAGTENPIVKVGIGYWFWLISCVITFIGGLIIRLKKN